MSKSASSKDPMILGRSRVTGRLVLRPAVKLKRIKLTPAALSLAADFSVAKKAAAKSSVKKAAIKETHKN
jgi:hypothetical protein